MRLKWLMSVMALVTAVVVGVDLSAQQAPAPQGGGGRAGGGGRGGFNLPPLLMTTDAFPDGGIVPQKYAGRGGVQPGFKFTGAPEGTMSYAIIFHDIDVSLKGSTGDVLHWIVWNIPAVGRRDSRRQRAGRRRRRDEASPGRTPTSGRARRRVRAITTTSSSCTR